MKNVFQSIPSHSKYKRHACTVINSILEEHPEYYPTIVALVSYPIQHWAEQKRAEITAEPVSLLTAVREYDDDAEGGSFFNRYSGNIDDTTPILKLTEDIISADAETKIQERRNTAVRNIHDYQTQTATEYTVKTHYEPALKAICSKNNRKFKKYMEQALMPYNGFSGELQFAYHNTDILIRMLKTVSSGWYLARSKFDNTEIIVSVNKAIDALKDYPFNGEEIYSVVRAIANGESERSLERKSGRSRRYIDQRYKEGVFAVSCILFGYSAREIAFGYTNIR